MDLSIIIVNWNSIEFTKKCIASIESTIHDLQYEVIVVDNASDDNCQHELSNSFPAAKLIRCPRNIGFAAANNVGVTCSCGRSLLFLNPDTVVLGDAIRRMIANLNAAGDIGAVGCRLLNSDFSVQTSCVQPFPTILNQLFSIDLLRQRWPTLALWGMQPLFSQNLESAEVDTVSGACIMVQREAYEEVNGFSSEYFMYAEEVDLCHKIRLAGRRVRYVPDAKVVHFGGQSTQKRGNSFSDVMMRDSVYKLLKKFRGRIYAESYRVSLFCSALLRLLVLLPFVMLLWSRSQRADLLNTFKKWLAIASWALTLHTRQACGMI